LGKKRKNLIISLGYDHKKGKKGKGEEKEKYATEGERGRSQRREREKGKGKALCTLRLSIYRLGGKKRDESVRVRDGLCGGGGGTTNLDKKRGRRNSPHFLTMSLQLARKKEEGKGQTGARRATSGKREEQLCRRTERKERSV